MTTPDREPASDEIQIGDIFAPLLGYRHLIWHTTVGATALILLVAGLYFFLQSIRWAMFVEFKPVFIGAELGQYPNKLPFASTDIVNATILDQVYDRNRIEAPCLRDDFRAGFVVEETSTELQFLDFDFQARLADARLTAVDRERLQNEYRARRQAMPVQYRLSWLRAPECRHVPEEVAAKAITEVLETWASDADVKRGVLKSRVAVLTPAIFDAGALNGHSLLVHADVIRAALLRVIRNVRQVEAMSGAELIQSGPEGASFAQVRAHLEDLVQLHLDPLVAVAGRGLGADAPRWVEQALAQAVGEHAIAVERADAYQTALREYSGLPPSTEAVTQRPQGGGSQTPSVTTQIDRTFIDRIVELTETNTSFRQELTRSLVDARILALETASNVHHYQSMLTSLKSSSPPLLTMQEVKNRLEAIISDAKMHVTQFNALYLAFSRASLRSGPAMYRVERPAEVRIVRPFTVRSFLILVAATLLGTPLMVSLGCLIHHAVRQMRKRIRRPAPAAPAT